MSPATRRPCTALALWAALLAGPAVAATPAVLAAPVSAAVQSALQTVLARGDHGAKPFVVIDKVQARLHVYAPDGTVLGSTPVLLGAARGDDSVPGIGEMPLEQITPEMRTTPAGRFLSAHGVNTDGEDVIWIDYDAAVSMHRLRVSDPSQRRLQRIASETPADNRISWGCVNVPARFYDGTLLPALRGLRAMVYVLPETRAPGTLFTNPDR